MPERRNPGDNKQEPVIVGEGIQTCIGRSRRWYNSRCNMERVGMEGNTDIIGRRTETTRRTGHSRRLGESGYVIILQILWGNRENCKPIEVLGQEWDQRRNGRRMGKIEMWGRNGMKFGAVGYVETKMKV